MVGDAPPGRGGGSAPTDLIPAIPTTFFLGIVGIWLVVGISTGVQTWLADGAAGASQLADIVLQQCLSASPWPLLTVGVVRVTWRFPLDRRPIGPVILAHGLAFVLVVVTLNATLIALYRFVGSPFVGDRPFWAQVMRGSLAWAHVNAVVYALIAAIAHWKRPRRSEVGGAPAAEGDRTVVLREGGNTIVMDPAEIDWLEAAGDYVRVHTPKGPHLVNHRLAALTDRLSGCGFVRVHRSSTVNVAKIRMVRPAGRGDRTIVLRNGHTLRMSRRRADALRSVMSARGLG